MAVPPFFDPSSPDTPANMDPTVSIGSITDVPSVGTGLSGQVFIPEEGQGLWSIGKLLELIATSSADQTFTATELLYKGKNSQTTLEQFLGDDAASLSGDGSVEFGPTGLQLNGFLYIPEGVHEISVASDDGFLLNIGGVNFSSFLGGRGTDETARVAEFEGGLYEVELFYFDGGGGQSLSLLMDGLPVDQSAFYQSVDDFGNPPADVATIPVADYHPSYFVGEESLEGPVEGEATDGADVITGMGSDDTIMAGAGDDHVLGGYGDDMIFGEDGDDVLDGGRGSDIVDGGAGNDLLVSRSDAGEQRIGQLAVGMPTRDDPDNEVNNELQKLKGYEDQPLHGDDVLIGGEGEDVFLISPQLNGKLDIIEKHVKADGSINWAGVAGENDELHDHWTDSHGIDIIADYVAGEDKIAVIGHTANVYVTHEDVIGDDALESIVTVISNQHGGGGAHAMDLIGQIIVHGDLVEADDIQTDDGVTYGIVEGYEDVAEALFPQGDLKESVIDGETYRGYDTRSPTEGANMQTGNGAGTTDLGAVTGNPGEAFENANFSEDMLGGGSSEEEGYIETRAPFDQLGSVEVAGVSETGNNNANTMGPDAPEVSGLPGALGFWSFGDGVDGTYGDDSANAGNAIKSYTLYENQALLRTDGTVDGPPNGSGQALYFNGEDDYAFMDHDPSMSTTQGTIAFWVRPDDLGEDSTMISKDHSGTVDGGHLRIGHTNEGGLFLRLAPGDGGGNKAWETKNAVFEEGEWAHVAVSYTDSGVTVTINGDPIGANQWEAKEGDVPNPNGYTQYFMMQNEEPWVLGADSFRAELNDTAQEFALDDEDLQREFEGALADIGIWGGFTPEDALSVAEINDLMDNGPGAALTNPSGQQPMLAGDDTMDGLGGNDVMDGGAGDDDMEGGNGRDSMQGGYGDDHLKGEAGNDTLDGGRGSDLLEGGDGNDVLYSRSDAGLPKAGQLVLDDPSRPDGGSIDYDYLKLFDWADQELVADDVLVGGAGADQFKFETLINGKKDILVEHTMDNRMIHWHGVAGENTYIQDHWVDSFGIDVIADFSVEEGDTISVIGHTTNIKIDYDTVDTNGDGVDDDMVSIITAYSQQGNGGGAHDEDYLGYIVVYGDKVTEDMVETDAGAHYGIVDTIDEIQEAVAPDGETRWTEIDGEMVYGYDTRDIDGDPIGSDPGDYSMNKWFVDGLVDLDSAKPEGLVAPGLVSSFEGGDLSSGESYEIPHTDAMLLPEGTVAMSFNADVPGNGNTQALYSKDHSGKGEGGHLTFYLDGSGRVTVRYQDTDSEVKLRSDERVEAGEDYHVAFSFDENGATLYLNGEVVDEGEGWDGGMTGNTEDIAIGASTMTRNGDNDNLQHHFSGDIENVLMFDRPLEDLEAVFLAEGDGEVEALFPLYEGYEAPEEEEIEEEEAEEEEVEEEEAEEEEVEEEEVEEEEAEEEEAEEEEVEEEEAEEEEVEEEEVEEEEAEEEEAEEEEAEEEEAEEEEAEEEEAEEEEAEEEEEGDEGIMAVISQLFMMIFTLFGLLGSGSASDEDVEDVVEDAQDLLTDLIPSTGDMDETMPNAMEEDEDDMMDAA